MCSPASEFQSTSGWTLDRAVRLITGLKDTTVELGIRRKDVEQLIRFTIKRARIKIDSIRGWQPTEDGKWDYLIDKKSRIGYVRLSAFMPQTAGDLDLAINQMEQDAPLNALILDLRSNPGGLLRQGVGVADRFLAAGAIVSVRGRAEQPEIYAAQSGTTTLPALPLVVIVNGRSAR